MCPVRLFVYGTMMTGQRDHAWLGGAEILTAIATAPRYTLVDVGAYAALVENGQTAVQGELYQIELIPLSLVDRACEVPGLFRRKPVVLADGTTAETHYLSMEQVRGKRRLNHGDWRERFAPKSVPHRDLPFARFARERFPKR